MTAKDTHSAANTTMLGLLAIVVNSLLLLGYFIAQATAVEPAPHAEAHSSLPSAATMPQTATWVLEGKPVPSDVLYTHETPAPSPAHEAKAQSWHNRVLFPSVRCPYCGRRVPTKKGSYIFLIIGLIGQIAFTGRFLVQWIATERARQSVIPEMFWYLSIIGSVLLLVYSVSIVAWPIILGQAPNILIYSRNLYFINKRKREALEPDSKNKADNKDSE